MTTNDIAQLRTLSEIARRLRRENERLREALGQATEAQRKFDEESEELFRLVEENRKRSMPNV